MEQRWPASKTRQTYLDFFCKQCKHVFVPSSSVVPYNDPTLLFANAGMNQFKPIFLGQVDPKSEQATWKRAANSQKCIRAGGKHNDLEAVGNDTYHHTFFEMLGNWSFGDYFKKEAIEWAWELLTKIYGLDQSRLYATYFGGDAKDGVPEDTDARNIWLQFLPNERVIPFGRKENFWEMGETGPCGPCSEIHYDRIGGRDATSLVNADDPTVIEIWNLVFIQFNREKDGSLRQLPAKHVDTGMGFERLLSVLQGVPSNYDTDLWQPIFTKIQEVTGAPPYSGKVGAEDKDYVDKAYRVIADHIRALTFAINDGAAPGPTGRNHVIRNILRRAVRYGVQILKANVGFFHKLVPAVIDVLGDAFPEIRRDPEAIISTIKIEEEAFSRTLTKGIRRFEAEVSKLEKGATISGEAAFSLYDTYGFPLELTKTMGLEKGLLVDEKVFNVLLDEQKERSEKAARDAANQRSRIELKGEAVSSLVAQGVVRTNDEFKYKGGEDITAVVKAIVTEQQTGAEKGSIVFTQRVTEGQVGLVLDRTNFYAEGGGQIFDIGTITHASDDSRVVLVEDVQVWGGYVLHVGTCKGEISVGDSVTLHIDYERRTPVMSNHTSTHMVNWALRETLGSGVEQRGSIVLPDRLRFDFSYGKPITQTELQSIDRHVGRMIEQNLKVYTRELPLKQALSISGIRAVFGEIYPDPVRVVSVGGDPQVILDKPDDPKWRQYSIELCGGTHLSTSGQANCFAVVSDDALASGVRRLVAVTGREAEQALETAERISVQLRALSALDAKKLEEAVPALQKTIDAATIPASARIELREKLDALRENIRVSFKSAQTQQQEVSQQYAETVIAALNASSPSDRVVHVGSLDVGGSSQALTNTTKVITKAHPETAILLLSVDSDPKKPKVTLTAYVPQSLVDRGFKANDWAKAVAQVVGGKGGGKPTTAQGSGSDVTKVEQAIIEAKKVAASLLK